MLSAVLLLGLILSLILTVRGLVGRSWIVIWAAALCSLVASILSAYAIGSIIFCLTCSQIAAAGAQRHRASWSQTGLAILAGVLFWVAIVPLQNAGAEWLGGSSIYPFVGMLGLIVALLPINFLAKGFGGRARKSPQTQ